MVTRHRNCRDCGDEITAKKNPKKGFADQCDDCSTGDQTERFIGYNDGTLNKAQHIAVYRGSDPKTKKRLLGHRMV